MAYEIAISNKNLLKIDQFTVSQEDLLQSLLFLF